MNLGQLFKSVDVEGKVVLDFFSGWFSLLIWFFNFNFNFIKESNNQTNNQIKLWLGPGGVTLEALRRGAKEVIAFEQSLEYTHIYKVFLFLIFFFFKWNIKKL